MNYQLNGKRIAILATDGFEQSELLEPKRYLEDAGAEVMVLSIESKDGKANEIRAWNQSDWGKTVKVDGLVKNAKTEEFDALVLPGGPISPDRLRTNKDAIAFVKRFAESGKPVGAICHGPSTLIEAGVVKGKTVTSVPSVHTDLQNAGAYWVDKEVVIDGNLITSGRLEAIPMFSRAIIESVARSASY